MANKSISGDVNVEFNEAQSRQSLESGESVKTLFGKLRKWLTDLGTAAFTNSTDYAAASHNQPSSTITAMTGYSKPQSTSAIAATDTLNEAIGKLEKGLDGAGTPNDGVLTIQQNGTTLGTFSANQAGNTTINIETEEPTYILGLRCDFENNTFTRLGDAVGLNGGSDFDDFPMYKRRRCNLDEFGRVTAYLGDSNYAEDGANGNVYVEQPAFYYKLKKDNYSSSTYYILEYWISNKPLSGYTLHPAFYDNKPFIYESAYEGYYNNSVLKSIAGVTPTLFTSYSSAPKSAAESLELLSARKMLMIIEYGQMNLQEAIGYGNVRGGVLLKTGTLSHIGNGTYGTTENYTTAVQWRGVENPWGNCNKIIGNFVASFTSTDKGNYVIRWINGNTASKIAFSYSLSSNGGFIKTFHSGYENIFIPAYMTGSSSLPVGDYFTWGMYADNPFSSADLPVLYGGSCNFGSDEIALRAGPFYQTCSYSYLSSLSSAKANIRISA